MNLYSIIFLFKRKSHIKLEWPNPLNTAIPLPYIIGVCSISHVLWLLKSKLGESDLDDSLKLVQGMTDESLQQLKVDLDEFLGDKEKQAEKKAK